VDEPLALAVEEPDAAGVAVVAAGVAAGVDAPAALLPAAESLPEGAAPPFKQLSSPELNEQDEQIKRMTPHTTSLNSEDGRL